MLGSSKKYKIVKFVKLDVNTRLRCAQLPSERASGPQVCAGARRVYRELRGARRLDAGSPRRTGASPLAAEHTLAELALAHSRIKLYFAFLRRKTEVRDRLWQICA